jgi:hypothetical protein
MCNFEMGINAKMEKKTHTYFIIIIKYNPQMNCYLYISE